MSSPRVNVPRVNISVWAEELYASCPGILKEPLYKAIIGTLREFCVQSGAFIVPLWGFTDNNLSRSDLLIHPIPIDFDQEGRNQVFNIQGMLETERNSINRHSLVRGSIITPTIYDYWPYDVLYVHRIAYYEDFHFTDKTGHRHKIPEPDPYGEGEHEDDEHPYAPSSPKSWLLPITEYAMRDKSGDPTKEPMYFSTSNSLPGTVEITGLTKIDPIEPYTQGFVPWVSLGFPHELHEELTDNSIPAIFSRYWYDVILSGTMSRLMRMPNKPFSNFQQSIYHQREFKAGIVSARDEARRRFLDATEPNRFPDWA